MATRRTRLALPLLFAAGGARADQGKADAEPRVFHAGMSLRAGILRGEAQEVAQDASFGFGLAFGWLFRPPHLALEARGDYDRFGGFRDTRDHLSYGKFALLATARAPWGRWRPWIGAGPGVAVGLFRSHRAELLREGSCVDPAVTDEKVLRCPAEEHAALPLLRGAAGVGFRVLDRFVLGLRVEHDWLLSARSVSETTADAPRTFRVFGDTIHFAIEGEYLL